MTHLATRRRRTLGALALLAAASVMLSGCLYSMIPEASPTSTESREPDSAGVAADLQPFYGQQLDWSACDTGFECTTVTAPLDWSHPSAGSIDLALIRQRATSGSSIGSLLINPGGPGASGISFVRDSVDFAVADAVQRQYDVVGFDPRGVGESTAVKCYGAADMDAYLFDIIDSPRGSADWEAARTQADQGFADACDANSNGILPYITTQNAARDLDLLRGVLGDKKLNFLGYSYGTFLGATYAGLYPDRVGRLVLDGALDPSISGLDVGAIQAKGFESALRAYVASCLEGSDCPFRGTVDDGMADISSLLASVDRDPLPSSDGRMLGADSLLTAILYPLYSRDSWPALTSMLTDVLAGNADYAFYIADFYYSRVDGEYTDNSTEAFRAYNCMDYPSDVTDAEQAAANARIEADAPTLAPYWEGPDPCKAWPYAATGTRGPITAAGADPIVVVGTTNDPATPYEWSVSLADQLESGTLITRVGEGHTGYNKGNACVDDAVNAYLLKGTVPEDGLRCE